MLRTNVHCLTPSPSKRPVDIKRGKSEYVDSPLHSENLFISELRFTQGLAWGDCFQYCMGEDKNVQWYNGCVKCMDTHRTTGTVDEPFKTAVSGVCYPTFVSREKFHYLFWGFFFREGCGWNSWCLRAEIITYIVQHPIFVCWAKISGTWKHYLSRKFLLWRTWGKGGEGEGKKGHSLCPVADEILEDYLRKAVENSKDWGPVQPMIDARCI